MEQQSLLNLIATLSSEQQALVEEFVKYLKETSAAQVKADFRAALESFVSRHPELLQRLAR